MEDRRQKTEDRGRKSPSYGRRAAGLTLIEMVVAFSAALIVFFATGIMMVFGQRSLNHGWEQANLQRNASYAMLRIKQSIRAGTLAQLDEDGRGVKVYRPAGWIRFWFVPAQRDLRYQLEGEEERTLLDNMVESMTFEIDSDSHKTVTVGLELQKDNCEARILSTTLLRNYGT
jgi:hypothetical protein